MVADACSSSQDLGSNRSCNTTSDCAAGQECFHGRCVSKDGGITSEAGLPPAEGGAISCTASSLPSSCSYACDPDWATAVKRPCGSSGWGTLYQCGAYHAVSWMHTDTADWYFYDRSGKLAGHAHIGFSGTADCEAYDGAFSAPPHDANADGFGFPSCVALGCTDAGVAARCTTPPPSTGPSVEATVISPPGVSMTGKVVALVPVSAPSCNDNTGSELHFGGSNGTSFGFVLDSGVRVALDTPFPQPFVQVGQTVHVEGQAAFCTSPNSILANGSVTVRNDSNQLIAWLGDGIASGMNEVTSQTGAPRCSYDDGCGVENFTDVVVGVGANAFTFKSGGTQQLGEYVVTYDGGPTSVTSGPGCQDWSPSNTTSMAVIHGNLTALQANPTCGGKQCARTEYCDIPIASGCFASDTSGTCKTRPATCPSACNAVFGCDGMYYCNDCEAHRAGFSATDDSLCAFLGSWTVDPSVTDGCSAGIQCFDRCRVADLYCDGTPSSANPSYEMRCKTNTDGGPGCECLHNGKVVSTAPFQTLCSAPQAVTACGFPNWILPSG
jgi:hypothetical protein